MLLPHGTQSVIPFWGQLQPRLEWRKKREKAEADKTKLGVGWRPHKHCRLRHYKSWGEAESTRWAGKINGELCAETRASTQGCVYAVRLAWLEE